MQVDQAGNGIAAFAVKDGIFLSALFEVRPRNLIDFFKLSIADQDFSIYKFMIFVIKFWMIMFFPPNRAFLLFNYLAVSFVSFFQCPERIVMQHFFCKFILFHVIGIDDIQHHKNGELWGNDISMVQMLQ